IQQGVSISIFVRKSVQEKNLGNVYHSEIFGLREKKFKCLDENNLKNIKWKKLDYKEPYFFYVPKDFGAEINYKEGFIITELLDFVSGIETKRDHFAIDFDFNNLKKRIIDFISDYSPTERKL